MSQHPRPYQTLRTSLLILSLLWQSLVPIAPAATPAHAAPAFSVTDNTCLPGPTNLYLPLINRSGPGTAPPTPSPLNLTPVSNLTAALGRTFSLQLAASGAQGPLTYSVAPLPLPPNATFAAASGRFTFHPDDSQVGSYTFTFAVTDGIASASQMVTIQVPAANPADPTVLSGQILDANAADQNQVVPLVGATVRYLTSNLTTTTDSRGCFTFTGLPPGEHYFEYDGSTATPAGTYGAYRGQKLIIAHVTNAIDRPIYIMKIDKAGETDVNPNKETIVTNPNIAVTVEIPANTVLDDKGQLYDGNISVSPVPDEFTPASLPNNLDPSSVLTIQPMGLTFRSAAPISFPNSEKLPVGSIVDIWSMDHELGKFFVAGKGEVKANGRIETVEGGIRESSWHFPLPPGLDGSEPGDGSCENCPPPQCSVASRLNPATGCVETAIDLPSYLSVGEQRQLQFSYLSDRAYPVPMIPFEATLSQQAAIPTVIQYQLRNFGGLTSGLATPVIWNKSGLSESKDEPLRGSVSVNGASLSTGVYPYSIRLTNQYGAASVSSDVNGRYLLVNDQNSAFGAGWGLAGLQHIYPQTDGDMLLVNGDGSSMRFESSNVLLEDNFDSEGPPASNYSTLLQWRVTRGTVDVIGTGFYDFYPNNGRYLDLDGSTNSAGRIETQTDLMLLPGEYQLSFVIGNNPEDPSRRENQLQVSLATYYSETFKFSGNLTLQTVERKLVINNPTSAKLVFDHAGGDNYGIILDNVKLERLQTKPATATTLETPFTVDGKSNIFAAGHHAASSNGGGVRPSGVQFKTQAGASFTFSSITGSTAFRSDCTLAGPDGGSNCVGVTFTNLASYNGISGLRHEDRLTFLAGVFLGSDEPFDPAPPSLTFSSTQDFTTYSPLLNQVFFIGDGKSLSGADQLFIAPPNATRLYLGIVDTCSPNKNVASLPGCYDDNIGSLNVVLKFSTSSNEGDLFASPEGDFSTLTRNADNTYTRRLKDGTEYTFNAVGLQTAMLDRNGNTTQYAYDSNNRLTTIIDPAGLVTTLAYNGARLGSVTDPMGRVTTFEHNGAGDLVKVNLPNNSSKQFGYDQRHLMTSETDELDFVTTRAYDAYGRLVSATLPESVTRSTSYAQKVGLLTDPSQGTAANPAPIVRPDAVKTTVTDGENRTTTYTFGPIQSIATTVDPAGLTTTINRDSDSNPTKYTYPSGQVINQSFDSRGNLLTVNDPNVQGTTSIGYEPLFNQPVTIKDPFNNVTNLTYDTKGNPIRIASPLNRTVRMAYNAAGLPTVITDTLGTVATLGYDAQGHLTQLGWGSGNTARNATFAYTPHGYLANLTDPLGRGFAYQYDTLGRLTQENLPGARLVSYGYDAGGNLTSLTPPGRPAHQFEYDGLGQLTAYIPPLIPGVSNPRTSYAYNKAQQVTQITRPDGLVISYGYDSAGRLQSTNFSRGALAYSYSPTSGHLTAISSPENVNLGLQYKGDLLTGASWSGALNGTVQRTYDAGYRTASITVNGAAIAYQYDADSAPTRAGALTLGYQPSSGLLANTTLANINDSFGYNSFGELQSYRANVGATPLYQTSYARDSLGRITTLTETITNTTQVSVYGYDAAGRLERVTRNGAQIASYSYDANGNRLSASDGNGTANGSYDDQDRLLSYGNVLYSYSANGELQSKTASGQQTTYSYDEFGNLTRATLPSGDVITYLIDGQDRRIGQRVNGVLQKGWLYEDQLRPVAELDGSGAVVSRFVYATRVNVPDYMVKGNVTYRLVLDHLGSVRLVVNTQSGEVVQRMDYDAWGVVTLDTKPGFQPFGFAGGLYDGQTGLVRFGARDYDAGVGRWTSKDPIGFEGGSTNMYQYANNDSANSTDINGKVVPLAVAHGVARICLRFPAQCAAVLDTVIDAIASASIGAFCYFNPNVCNTPPANDNDPDECDSDSDCEDMFIDLVGTYLEIIQKEELGQDVSLLKQWYEQAAKAFCQACPEYCSRLPRF